MRAPDLFHNLLTGLFRLVRLHGSTWLVTYGRPLVVRERRLLSATRIRQPKSPKRNHGALGDRPFTTVDVVDDEAVGSQECLRRLRRSLVIFDD